MVSLAPERSSGGQRLRNLEVKEIHFSIMYNISWLLQNTVAEIHFFKRFRGTLQSIVCRKKGLSGFTDFLIFFPIH